jgi:hypothetical protein
MGPASRDIATEKVDPTSCGFEVPSDQIDQSSLPRTIRANQSSDFTGLDIE